MSAQERFPLRKKPKAPQRRRNIQESVSVHGGMSVQDIINVAELRTPGIELDATNVFIGQEHGYDGPETIARYSW